MKHSMLHLSSQLIFLRQGEKDSAVNGSAMFSPFNVRLNPVSDTDKSKYKFTDYPSMAGGLKVWSVSTTMFSPLGSVTWETDVSEDTISNICPEGYRIPSSDEFRQLLSVTGATGTSHCMGGLYADGYFDRGEITVSGSSIYSGYSVGENTGLAFGGLLIYNIQTYASIFIPFAGRRDDKGWIAEVGYTAYNWSATLETIGEATKPYYLKGVKINTSPFAQSNVDWWCNKGDGNSIRPVLDR